MLCCNLRSKIWYATEVGKGGGGFLITFVLEERMYSLKFTFTCGKKQISIVWAIFTSYNVSSKVFQIYSRSNQNCDGHSMKSSNFIVYIFGANCSCFGCILNFVYPFIQFHTLCPSVANVMILPFAMEKLHRQHFV